MNFVFAFISIVFGAWLMYLHQDFQSFYLSLILAVVLKMDDSLNN